MSELTAVDAINGLEAWMVKAGALRSHDTEREMPVTHRFTPGLYVREIFMPAGHLVISKIHKTEHPFVISKGKVAVFIEEDGWQVFAAPHTGITKPGTQRVLFIIEDTVWLTFHPTQLTDVDAIEEEIIEKRDNPLLKEIAA